MLLDQNTVPVDLRSKMAANETLRKEYLEALSEDARRRTEALRLYEPSPFQKQLHECPARQVLLMKGNQVGGSLCSFVEIARAVTNQDPYKKYPDSGNCLVLGYKEDHIGTVIHKYLFRSDAFKIIRDRETKEWRTWKPWLPDDKAREGEARPAPPLIPKRYIKKMAWLKRKTYVFQECELTTGWTIYARGSKGEPLQGVRLHVALFDEDLERPGWYNETGMRFAMSGGKLIWNALPHMKNDAMLNLLEQCERDAGQPQPRAVCIRATIFDNPYMPEDSRKEMVEKLKALGDDEYRRRALGEMPMESRLMYPTFEKGNHGAIRESDDASPVQKALLANNGVPPSDWCRYMSVDPGHVVCAVTFYAVPPESLGCEQVVCYDELYIQKCDADDFGRLVKDKVSGDCIQAFIIDMHGGKLRSVAGGDPPHRQYSNALRKYGVSSVATGHNFLHGSDDIKGREMLVREWLRLSPEGRPKLLIHLEKCPNLVTELMKFKKKVVENSGMSIVSDDGDRRMTHAVETLEYAVAHGLRFIKQPSAVKAESLVARVRRDERRRHVRRLKEEFAVAGFGGINLGPQGTQ